MVKHEGEPILINTHTICEQYTYSRINASSQWSSSTAQTITIPEGSFITQKGTIRLLPGLEHKRVLIKMLNTIYAMN